MIPQKLSTNLFLEYPPVFHHYVESERNLWLEGSPREAKLSLLGRPGKFAELEALAVERRHHVEILGVEHARMLEYRIGFEVGRRDAIRHLDMHGDNVRLALQASLAYGQLQGLFIAETRRFEMDSEQNTMIREIRLTACTEASIHRSSGSPVEQTDSGCWRTLGYLSGHASELLDTRVLTIEGGRIDESVYTLISRFDHEWGPEADWCRDALSMGSMGEEISKHERMAKAAQAAAKATQMRLTRLQRRTQNVQLAKTSDSAGTVTGELGKRISQLAEVATPVLLWGEAGTGKETLARTIHQASARKDRPIVAIDMRRIPAEDVLAELFAGENSAWKRAAGGSLYIAAIDQMPHDAQQELLGRISNEGDVRVMGSTAGEPVDAFDQGTIDSDLYYAMRPGVVHVAPLRERQHEIPAIASSILADLRARHERPGLEMSAEVIDVFRRGSWPENVRELRSAIEHAIVVATSDEIQVADLPDDILVNRARQQNAELTREMVEAALRRTRNNKSRAAELLGVGRTTLWRAMKRYEIA